jgi:hypothetical protein
MKNKQTLLSRLLVKVGLKQKPRVYMNGSHPCDETDLSKWELVRCEDNGVDGYSFYRCRECGEGSWLRDPTNGDLVKKKILTTLGGYRFKD